MPAESSTVQRQFRGNIVVDSIVQTRTLVGHIGSLLAHPLPRHPSPFNASIQVSKPLDCVFHNSPCVFVSDGRNKVPKMGIYSQYIKYQLQTGRRFQILKDVKLHNDQVTQGVL